MCACMLVHVRVCMQVYNCMVAMGATMRLDALVLVVKFVHPLAAPHASAPVCELVNVRACG